MIIKFVELWRKGSSGLIFEGLQLLGCQYVVKGTRATHERPGLMSEHVSF